jgi:hypothetical protein
MPSTSSQPQSAEDALGTRLYEYRYPLAAKLIAIGIVLLAPVAIAGFLQLVLRPGSFSDRIIPAVMAVIIVGCAAFLAYRQAYFAWSVITVYERGLRFDFWRKHLVIPWTNLGKFYLGPGRMPSWHITDGDEHILCELRTSLSGRRVDQETGATTPEIAPSIIDAIVEEGRLTERELPFRHYAPGARGPRKKK